MCEIRVTDYGRCPEMERVTNENDEFNDGIEMLNMSIKKRDKRISELESKLSAIRDEIELVKYNMNVLEGFRGRPCEHEDTNWIMDNVEPILDFCNQVNMLV